VLPRCGRKSFWTAGTQVSTPNPYEPPRHAIPGTECQQTTQVFVLLFSVFGVYCVSWFGIGAALYYLVVGDNSPAWGKYAIAPALAIAALSLPWLRNRKSKALIVACVTSPMVLFVAYAVLKRYLRWP